MPVELPQELVGKKGLAIVKAYSSPEFMYTALSELEDAFVRLLKYKFGWMKLENEIDNEPVVRPSYSLLDREFYSIVVEASINQIGNQGLGYNMRELTYQPDEDDPNNYWIYWVASGDAIMTVELFCRGPHHLAVSHIADWTLAALMDPTSVRTALEGLQIPLNKIRYSGKPVPDKQSQADPKQLPHIVTMTIPEIVVPWTRLYKMEGPSIATILERPTIDSDLSS